MMEELLTLAWLIFYLVTSLIELAGGLFWVFGKRKDEPRFRDDLP